MIPKSLWAHSLVPYKHFPEHSHSLDCSGGPSSSIRTLRYSLPPQFLTWSSDHYPVYFVPSPLHMSLLFLPQTSIRHYLNISVWYLEVCTVKEERFTVRFPSLLFHASDMLCTTSTKCLFFRINIQFLISFFYRWNDASRGHLFLLLCPSVLILPHILHGVSSNCDLTYWWELTFHHELESTFQ